MLPFVTQFVVRGSDDSGVRGILEEVGDTCSFEEDGAALKACDGVVLLRYGINKEDDGDGMRLFTHYALHGTAETTTVTPPLTARSSTHEDVAAMPSYAAHSRIKDKTLYRSTLILWNLSDSNAHLFGLTLYEFLHKHECAKLLVSAPERLLRSADLKKLLDTCMAKEMEGSM